MQCFISGYLHLLRENNSKSLMDSMLMFNSSEKLLFLVGFGFVSFFFLLFLSIF